MLSDGFSVARSLVDVFDELATDRIVALSADQWNGLMADMEQAVRDASEGREVLFMVPDVIELQRSKIL